jgi:hypothetical protein
MAQLVHVPIGWAGAVLTLARTIMSGVSCTGQRSGAVVARNTLDLASAPEVFRPALVAELRERPFEFDIQVQLCADID